jgi:hypothetical protein
MTVEMYSNEEIDPVLQALVGNWLTKIEAAKKHKDEVFSKGADECQSFFDGPKDWNELMGRGSCLTSDGGFPELDFKVSVNKTFEFVTIFGPSMYYENPVRTAKPFMPVIIPPDFFPDPSMYQAVMMQENQRIKADGLRGVLLEAVMNWSPNDFKLSDEARQSIDEALIKGRGCMWTELYRSPSGAVRAVRSFFDSVEALLIDPDAESFDSAKWIARRKGMAVWEAERLYGLREGSLKGHGESLAKQADVDSDDDLKYERRQGKTNDLIVIYHIYSKMGIGGRMMDSDSELVRGLDLFGDYCQVIVAEGVPFPLNLPPDITSDPNQTRETIFDRTNWPIPFWEARAWPVRVLDFHKVAKSAWPTQHLKAGMGELKFLNWVMSFLMGKLRTTLRDIIAVKKGVAEKMKDDILHGGDLVLVEIEGEYKSIKDILEVFRFDPVNADVWKMLQEVGQQFDKRVGLTELMYGSSGATQIRSAQEAEVRNQNMSVRPDDMAKQVEAWMAEIAASEALALRWLVTGQDVSAIIGPVAAMAWDQYVVTKDLGAACHQLEYRIEAGSMKRPNKTTQNQQINQFFQAASPLLSQYGTATGDMGPMNNLLGAYAKSLELDPNQFQLAAPIPPPPPPPGEEPPAGSEKEGGGPPPK